MRAPGKRSSASSSVEMPFSATRRPTKRPPLRAGSFMLVLARLPASNAVLDLGRLRRPCRLLRLELRRIHLDVDLPALGALAGTALALPGLLVLVARIAPSQAAGGVQVARGGCCSTHGSTLLWDLLNYSIRFFSSASTPGASRAASRTCRPPRRRD